MYDIKHRVKNNVRVCREANIEHHNFLSKEKSTFPSFSALLPCLIPSNVDDCEASDAALEANITHQQKYQYFPRIQPPIAVKCSIHRCKTSNDTHTYNAMQFLLKQTPRSMSEIKHILYQQNSSTALYCLTSTLFAAIG